MRPITALSIPGLLLGATALTAAPAQAHTPLVSASCDGVHVAGTNYDPAQANRWSVTIGDVTQSGTFGSSFDQTFPVPQDGATTAWSAFVEAEDGTFRGADAGTVGPCGTPPPPSDACPDNPPGDQPPGTMCTPPPNKERSAQQSVEGCDVSFQGKEYGAGRLTYDEQFTDTYVFNSDTNTWDLVTDTTPTVANVVFTPWSVPQQVAADCLEKGDQPPAEHTSASTTELDCNSDMQVTTTTTTTTPYVYDEQTNTWVPGESTTSTTTDKSPVQPGDCDEGEQPPSGGQSPPTEVAGAQATVHQAPAQAQAQPKAAAPAPKAAAAPSVPTEVDAGVGGTATTAGAGSDAPAGPGAGALVLLAVGGLLLGASVRKGRRA